MLGDIGFPELLVILIIVLMVFGPSQLPGVGKALGEALRGFKRAFKESDEAMEEKTGEKDRNGSSK
jgi:sec-independent protein translocase protein TatA